MTLSLLDFRLPLAAQDFLLLLLDFRLTLSDRALAALKTLKLFLAAIILRCLDIPELGGPTSRSWPCRLRPYGLEKPVDVFRAGFWVEDMHKEVLFINVNVRR